MATISEMRALACQFTSAMAAAIDRLEAMQEEGFSATDMMEARRMERERLIGDVMDQRDVERVNDGSA